MRRPGKLGAVTIATNMAGRGTDIKLGGNAEYLAKGGNGAEGIRRRADYRGRTATTETDDEEILAAREHVYRALYDEFYSKQIAGRGREGRSGGRPVHPRHRAARIRRIDNQLRGRAGRQGDPGESRFFLSLEDDLMRLFGSERRDGR